MYAGAFICIYVGNLFESEEANKQGQNYGDEYFADLDMIETVERQKVRENTDLIFSVAEPEPVLFGRSGAGVKVRLPAPAPL